jgi:hypothetical protein
VNVEIVSYPGESDRGPYPLPDQVPIEGWPASFQRDPSLRNLTLLDVQRDKIGQGGDRHAIVVDPVNRMLYEFYQLKLTDRGWQAAQASIFDLKSNRLRPDGWTSTDAAGLPIFPAVVRYDELKRGLAEHAMRVTVGLRRAGHPLRQPARGPEPAADGRAAAVAGRFRRLPFLACGSGDSPGSEEVRHVRRRQRPGLGHLHRPRSANPPAPRRAPPRERVGF